MNGHKRNQCFIEMEWSQKFNIERKAKVQSFQSLQRVLNLTEAHWKSMRNASFAPEHQIYQKFFAITVLQLFHRFIAVHCISFLWISFCAVPCSCSSLRHRRANCALHSVVAGSRRHRSRALQGVRRPEVDHE